MPGKYQSTNNDAPAPVYHERQTIGLFWQTMAFMSRAIVQQTRDLASLLIDFGLVFMGGLFLGLVFTNIQYEGIPCFAK